jgi:hypothetical protein
VATGATYLGVDQLDLSFDSSGGRLCVTEGSQMREYNAANGSFITSLLSAGGSSIGINVVSDNLQPTFDSLSSPTITYGTSSTLVSGHIAAGALTPAGTVFVILNGVTQPAILSNG